MDANFFFIPAQFTVDIFEELADLLKQRFEPVLLSSTLAELQGLCDSSSLKTHRQALSALEFSKKCRFVEVERRPSETFDDVVLRVASEWNCSVATNDKEMRKRLRAAGVAVIFLRQRRRLALDGSV